MPGFADLAARLAELEKLPSRVTREAAASITDQLHGQFDAGVNAYRQPWAPLKPSTIRRKRGDARILRRTDALSSEIAARPMSGAGIEIVWLDYAEKHQTGTKWMVARKILPDGSGLPRQWSEAIRISYANAFGEALK